LVKYADALLTERYIKSLATWKYNQRSKEIREQRKDKS
jgi:hypothetical protein